MARDDIYKFLLIICHGKFLIMSGIFINWSRIPELKFLSAEFDSIVRTTLSDRSCIVPPSISLFVAS